MDDLQLHYGKYWADEMGLTEEEIVEQIKQAKKRNSTFEGQKVVAFSEPSISRFAFWRVF